mmetsp:Transcript_30151/g.97026  ORF Transcript_30151/g.97026 Transcript_30151/m.97026 type:complete len:107 (+) Transcript_30151:851-1171(+)
MDGDDVSRAVGLRLGNGDTETDSLCRLPLVPQHDDGTRRFSSFLTLRLVGKKRLRGRDVSPRILGTRMRVCLRLVSEGRLGTRREQRSIGKGWAAGGSAMDVAEEL